jgi:hypothetical protein
LNPFIGEIQCSIYMPENKQLLILGDKIFIDQ